MPKKTKSLFQSVPELSSNTIIESSSVNPAKRWTVTHNNYTDDDIELFCSSLKDKGDYVFELEDVDIEDETPHIQGYIVFNDKQRPCTFFKGTRLEKAHFEIPHALKRNKSLVKEADMDSWKYCTQDNREGIKTAKIYHSQWPKFLDWFQKTKLKKRELFQIQVLKPFQQEIYDSIFNFEPDRRTIRWFWQGAETRKGNIGKSVFVNYLYDNHPHEVLIFDKGKYEDLCYAITEHDMDYVRAVIWDMPRGCMGNASAITMECILNGRIRSTKYEGGFKRFAPVHIIVVSNFPPSWELTQEFSEDRLKVTELSDDL